MKLKLIIEKMQELGFDLDEKTRDEFKHLARVTALRKAQDETYYVRNCWRRLGRIWHLIKSSGTDENCVAVSDLN